MSLELQPDQSPETAHGSLILLVRFPHYVHEYTLGFLPMPASPSLLVDSIQTAQKVLEHSL